MDEIVHVTICSVCSIIALFSLTKILRNREMSQLSMFDYIRGITIGSITSEMDTLLEEHWKSLLTPYDSGIELQTERLLANMVVDRKILKENLSNIGKTEQWLIEELHKKGISHLKKFFLVTCDVQDKLTIYKKVEQPNQKDIL